MSTNVQFDEDNFENKSNGSNQPAGGFQGFNKSSGNEPKMVQWLMRIGLVKSPAAANGILLGIVVVCVVAIYLAWTYF